MQKSWNLVVRHSLGGEERESEFDVGQEPLAGIFVCTQNKILLIRWHALRAQYSKASWEISMVAYVAHLKLAIKAFFGVGKRMMDSQLDISINAAYPNAFV